MKRRDFFARLSAFIAGATTAAVLPEPEAEPEIVEGVVYSGYLDDGTPNIYFADCTLTVSDGTQWIELKGPNDFQAAVIR